MDREKAEALAALLDGDAWQSGGGIYVVLVTNSLGQIILPGIGKSVLCLQLIGQLDCRDRGDSAVMKHDNRVGIDPGYPGILQNPGFGGNILTERQHSDQ